MNKLNITFGNKVENVPTCATLGSINSGITVPYGNDIFNKVYYKEYEGKITAFKVLAWAIVDGFGCLSFLVLFPNGTTEWKKSFLDNTCQLSVEDVVMGKQRSMRDLFSCCLACNGGVFSDFCDRHCDVFYFRNSFRYANGKLEREISGIRQIYGTPDGVFVRLFHTKPNCSSSEEELRANKFNGMEVVDFAEPIKIDIEIGGEVKKKIKFVD